MAVVVSPQSAYAGFTPQSIPGCVLWLDAGDTSTLTFSSGSNVASWRDKSGNGANATGVNNPTYLSASSGVDFVIASSQYMTLPNSCLPFGNSGYSYFFIFTPKTNTAGQQLMVGGALTTAGDSIGMRTGDAGTGTLQTYWNNYDMQTTNTYTLNVKNFGAFDYKSGGARRIWINFTQGATDTPTVSRTQTITNNAIGRLGALSTGYFGGQMHEIIAYNDSLTAAERQQIEGYLATKWGLKTSIPATHPFKALPPFTRPFTPLDVPSCSLWLDAADSSTLTLVGSSVTQWNDKSGNGRNVTQATTTPTDRRPTYSSGVLNFNGANFFTGTNTFSVLNSGTLFAVARHSGTRGRAIDIRNNTMSLGIEFGTTPDLFFHNSSGQWIQNFANGTNALQIMVVTRNESSAPQYARNGTSLISFTTSQLSSANNGSLYNIGSDSGVAEFLNGILCEILHYETYLTTSQRQQVETYLATKWGLRGSTPATHFARLGIGLTPLFTPPQVPGCVVWLDAADDSTLTLTGFNVTAWRDKSGNANNSVATNGSPVYSATRINGRPGILFDNTTIRGGLSATIVTPQVHCFIAMTVLSTSGEYPRFFLLSDGVNLDHASTQNFLAFSKNASALACSRGSYANGTLITNTPCIATASVNTGINSIGVNGINTLASANSGYTANMNASRWVVGGAGDGGPTWNARFHVGEIIAYTGVLTVSQRQQVEGYLATKWGIKGSIPTAHPYKKIVP